MIEPNLIPPDSPVLDSPASESPAADSPIDGATLTPDDAARCIIDTLGETEPTPVRQITLIVSYCGVEQAMGWLHEAQRIEANGGMMTTDQSRRRTLGGVFFYVARGAMKRKHVDAIFDHIRERHIRMNIAQAQALPEQRRQQLAPLNATLEPIGKVDSVSITIVGRPGQVDLLNANLVVTRMTHFKVPSKLPKGLPPFPDTPTEYVVYVAYKQWQKVAEAMTDPDDQLIVEGAPTFDAALGAMVVYAQDVASLKTRRAAEAARAERKAAKKAAPAESSAAAPALASQERHAQLSQRASELQARINEINALPFSQRKGLVELVKELQAVKTELEGLAVR